MDPVDGVDDAVDGAGLGGDAAVGVAGPGHLPGLVPAGGEVPLLVGSLVVDVKDAGARRRRRGVVLGDPVAEFDEVAGLDASGVGS
jgi:hypothetical protein